MEKKNVTVILILGYWFFVAGCSNKTESSKKEADITKTKHGINETMITEPTTVHWMYLDDSLRNGCKPLNYILPWMESDIFEIPENITPEIFSIPVIKNFEVLEKEKERKNDSIFLFAFKLKKADCLCDVYRMYKRNPKQEKTSGFLITEQIVCNTKNNDAKNEIETNQKDDKYEVHGHEH